MYDVLFEHGILPLFRLFAIVRALIIVPLAVGWLLFERQAIPFPGFMETLLTIGLLLYLYLPFFSKYLGKAFIPIAIAITALTPIIAQPGMIRVWLNINSKFSNFISVTQSIPMIFILAIIIVWQYDTLRLWMFCIAMTLFEMLWYLRLSVPIDELIPIFAIIVGVRLIAAPVVGHAIALLITFYRTQQQSLIVANRRLMNHTMTVEQLTVSRERNRLARELHDTLAHTLSAVAVQLEAVRSLWEYDSERAKVLLSASLTATRGGLQEARRALHELRAMPLEDLGLILALERLAKSCAERAGVQCTLQLPKESLELPAAIEQSIYRIAQEALENIVRHAQANQCTLSLQQHHALLRLEISDDGQGFVVTQPSDSKHFGLQGMYERADVVGGHLVINSDRQRGTHIHFTVRMDSL